MQVFAKCLLLLGHWKCETPAIYISTVEYGHWSFFMCGRSAETLPTCRTASKLLFSASCALSGVSGVTSVSSVSSVSSEWRWTAGEMSIPRVVNRESRWMAMSRLMLCTTGSALVRLFCSPCSFDTPRLVVFGH